MTRCVESGQNIFLFSLPGSPVDFYLKEYSQNIVTFMRKIIKKGSKMIFEMLFLSSRFQWLIIIIMKIMVFCEYSFKCKTTGEPRSEEKEGMEPWIHSACHVWNSKCFLSSTWNAFFHLISPSHPFSIG